MIFEQKHREITTFDNLERGETFILHSVQDCSVEPNYYDCVCVKIVMPGLDEVTHKLKYGAVNLTLNRIEPIDKNDKVERILVKLVEYYLD